MKHSLKQTISIGRQSTTVLADLIKLNNKGLDIELKPNVEFCGEDGVDASELTREYFNLIMHALVTGDRRVSLFEG